METLFFPLSQAFREWLTEHHGDVSELLVGFYKKGSGKGGISYPEAVDQALCFGWIDGVRRTIDADSYTVRFTPRKPRSVWSLVNIKRVEELTAQGLMQPPGLEAFAKRDEERAKQYSYERAARPLVTATKRCSKPTPHLGSTSRPSRHPTGAPPTGG